MDKFIVSARKYRPQNFNSVVGQSHITTTLKNAIRNNQLAHAFLFCGPRGVGKTTCARILAKTINCENLTPDIEACNVCNSCVSFENGTSLNIHELDAASNNSVDDIRTLVDQVRFVPQAGKYKIYIVDEVHMLSTSAFNAFLKTLEEPPPYAIFILATTEKHKILPTILSRCQIFDFKRITNNDTVEHLREISEKEHITADRTALHVIAQKSEGCLRDALSILDKIVSFTNGELTYANTLEHLNILDEEYFFRLLQTMQKQDMAATLLMYDEINRKGFEGDIVINSFSEFIRNVLVCKDDRVASLLEVSEDFKPKYQEVAKQSSLSYLLSALQILNDADLNYKMARNKRLHVELALIKLCYLQQAITITDDGDKLNTKKQLAETGKPVAFKAIQPIAVKPVIAKSPTVTQTAKLIIEQALPDTSEKVDIISEPEIPVKKIVESPTPVTRIGSLDKLRQKVKEQNKAAEPARPLIEDELKLAWQQFVDQLKKNNNHSAILHFNEAELKIIDNNTIEIIAESLLQQSFIDNERALLIEHLQKYFNNRTLLYKLIVVPDENKKHAAQIYLSAKDQYVKMVEHYPLVKQLKESLKLNLKL